MCGIVGYVGKENAASILLNGLERLEYRGYDSCGIATIKNNEIIINKTTGRIAELKKITNNGENIIGNAGIGHTRWATHGEPSFLNAHPHSDNDNHFAVVHNGIIENYAELKNELIKKGIKFKSDTDTEVIAHLLKENYDGDVLSAITKTVKRLKGSFALGILSEFESDALYAVKKFSPLIIGLKKDGNLIGSDITALINHTRDVIYLNDGEIAKLSNQNVTFYNSDGKIIEKEISLIDWSLDAAEKGGYDHFMMKEIMEEAEAVKKTIEPRIKNGQILFDNLKLSDEKIKSIKRIIISACGSAYHAAFVAKYMYEELLRIPTDVELASEFRYKNPIVSKDSLVIIISQSGETADTLAALLEAKSRGAHTLSIVNVVGSSIANESDDCIYTYAGPEFAVATTKGYTTQLSVLYLLGVYFASIRKSADEKLLSKITNELSSLDKAIENVLKSKEEIKKLANEFWTDESVFFIGRNMDYAVALEGSLKLKEISYIHSEAYAAGELKHGTISLIEKDRLVIALCCYEELKDKIYSNIKEVTSRGAKVLATAFCDNEEIKEYTDKVIYLPKVHPLLLAIIEVIPLQLFAYYMASLKGNDIDKPRNLAKSVTVE